MLQNADILTWLKSLPVKANNYYAGTLNSKKEKSFGVYNIKSGRAAETAIGGTAATKTATHGTSVLVHWNANSRDTQAVACELYDAITTAERPMIGGKQIYFIQPQQNEPVDVGTDENGVFEYVIEIVFYYERG